MTLQEVWSLLNLYNSSFSGEQIDEAIGLILNGGISAAVEAAQRSADAAAKSASEAAGSAAGSGSAETNAQNAAAQAAESANQAKRYAEQAHAIAGENLVFSVNGVQADETGNVQIPTGGVKTINGNAPDDDGDITLDAGSVDAIPANVKGKPKGVAELDAEGKVPEAQLPETMTPSAHAESHKTGGSDPLTPEGIGAGRVNPNILHNWYFGNPVNQRGQTEYSASYGVYRYSVDRWRLYKPNSETEGTAKVSDKHLELNLGVPFGRVDQPVENYTELIGKQATFTMLFEDELPSDVVLVANEGGWQETKHEDEKLVSLTFTLTEGAYRLYVGVQNNSDTAVTVKPIAAKLELGTQQTLAHQDADGNWVLNEIPDYGEQLAICQRYFLRCSFAAFAGYITESGNFVTFKIPTPVPMRAAPSITTQSGFDVYTKDAMFTVTTLSSTRIYGLDGVVVSYATPTTKPASTIANVCCNGADGNMHFDLSADL